MSPHPKGPYAPYLRSRVADLFLINPQVSLISRDGRFATHRMGLFETIGQALTAALSDAGCSAAEEPVLHGIYAYLDPVHRFHTIDFAHRFEGSAGPAFREPAESERWILAERRPVGGPLHEHVDLGKPLYEQSLYRHVRPLIGTDWLLGIGASSAITREDGKILLQKRRDNGLWSHPGGCLEPGERIVDAARREVEEETGYVVGGLELVGVLSGPGCAVTYANGDKLRYLDFLFTGGIVGGAPRPTGEETIDVGWFDPAALPPDTMGCTRRYLALASERPRGHRPMAAADLPFPSF